MELAILTGHGPPGLLDGDGPLLEPADVVLLGHRPDELHADVAARERPPRPGDPGAHRARGARARRRPGGGRRRGAARRTRPAWLHLDLDVLDEAVLPAVSYPQPLGLDWDELVALVRPLVAAPNLLGVSVADFNPDKDRRWHSRRARRGRARIPLAGTVRPWH